MYSIRVTMNTETTFMYSDRITTNTEASINSNTEFQLSASTPSLEQPLSICPISFNLILQQDNYDLHLTHEPLSPPV